VCGTQIQVVRYWCLSLVPPCVLRLISFSFRTARHLFVRALLNSSKRIHCIPSASWDVQVAGGVFFVGRIWWNISLAICGMLIAHSSPCQPFSMRSSISSLHFSSFFGRRGGRVDITSYHQCWIWGLFPRDVCIKVREVRVSSVLELSLHCSSSSAVLEIVRYVVSFTLRSPKGGSCVFHVSKSLSHTLINSSILSRWSSTPSSPFRSVHWLRSLFRFTMYLSASFGVFVLMMMIAFITIKSSLVPLIEGLCAQI